LLSYGEAETELAGGTKTPCHKKNDSLSSPQHSETMPEIQEPILAASSDLDFRSGKVAADQNQTELIGQIT
jgi:hypothetical protein